jgi:hypothetical protein
VTSRPADSETPRSPKAQGLVLAGQVILIVWSLVVSAVLVDETVRGFASPVLFLYPAALIALAVLASRWPRGVGAVLIAFHLVAGILWITGEDYGPVVAVYILPAPLAAGTLLLASRPRARA